MEGTRLPWRPGLERTQLLIGLAVEIQVTFAAEGKWTGDSGAAVPEETAAAVGVRLFVEAEILVAGAVHLKGTCRHKREEMRMVGNKHRTFLWKDRFANRRDSRVAPWRRIGQVLFYRPKIDVMPSSLELSISLSSSALKKSFHSPQRESLQPAFPCIWCFLSLLSTSCLGQEVVGEPALWEM